jgi:uncharacterized membrane protein
MNKLKQYILAAAILVSTGLAAVPAVAGAVEVFKPCAAGAGSNSSVCASKDENADGLLKIIVNTLLFILGAISVIVIIIGGILYTVSGGDSSNITKAKNTILYAVIGLVVALMAFPIVNYVIDQLT